MEGGMDGGRAMGALRERLTHAWLTRTEGAAHSPAQYRRPQH